MPQLVVFATGIGDKLCMASMLDDRAPVKHGDLVAELAGGQSVGNIYCSFVSRYLIEFAVYLSLRDRVERRRRLVKNYKRSVLVKRAGNGDFLRLAARNINSVFVVILVEICFRAVPQLGKSCAEARFFKAIDNARPVVIRPARNIFSQL